MQTIGRYRIDARIGEGAMADVYAAHDPGIGRVVAIKVLKPEYRNDPGIVSRFLRESKAAGQLNHPHIATIYDVGDAGGVPYIAMEHLEGRPLDTILAEQGRMPHERALALAAQLAEALAYAHRIGVVHRDIKPSNIMLVNQERTAKLLDFGIARIDGDVLDRHALQTQVGQVIGTPRYMSPEQALGLPVDARADLFSLGVVLYEMVTGKVAFAGSGLATLAIQIAQRDPEPIDRSVKDCPKGLRFIIEKLLAKKPEARFADAADLHAAIVREIEALKADDGGRRRGLALRFKLPLILSAATAAVLAASVATVLDRQSATLERMALTSGASITAFVTSNAALYAADNAGLPPGQQDWVPLQAFVSTATRDSNVRRLVVVDDGGIVRAAGDRNLIGRHYVAPTGETRVDDASDADIVTESHGAAGDGFRFVRPIKYAGADFGKVDMVLGRGALDAALANARMLLVSLSILVMGVVFLIGYLSAASIARPIRRLRRALDDAGNGNLSFRLSSKRRDEFGAAFEAFNRMADALEPQLDHKDERAARALAIMRTRVERSAPPARAA